jgi:pimeloyl-ACP methyl ester carboxylesterase
MALAGALLSPAAALGTEFYSTPCWSEVKGRLETRCGYLLVSEQRSDPASRLLRLPVVIFNGREPAAVGLEKSEPILILNGGPGGSNWVYNGGFLTLWEPFVDALQVPASRDVILFSQRGTDNTKAMPAQCPVFTEPEYFMGASRRPGQQTDWRANVTKGISECREALESAGYPFAAYSSRANIEDIKELRAALGLGKLAVYGVSYGARLTLELARHAGAGLTRLVLDSPSPPDGDFSFRQIENLLTAMRQLEEICGNYESCRPHKRIESNFRRLAKRLDTKPREIRIRSQVTDGSARSLYLNVDSPVLVDILFFSFYFSERLMMIPEALSNAIANDFELLARLAGQAYFFDTGINYVTNTSVYCQDTPGSRPTGAIRSEMRTYPEFGNFLENALWLHQTICPLWLPEAEIHVDTDPVPLAIPTLILSGGLDPITPRSAARSLLQSLPEARIVFDPEATHGTLAKSGCIRNEVEAFLKGELASDRFC